jgi:predicted outer membrane protein
MKPKINIITCWYPLSFNPALALLLTLGAIATASPLLGNDHEDRDKTLDRHSSALDRDRDQKEDLNAKTEPEKFIRQIAQSGMKEIRLGALAKQRAQSQEVKQFAEKLVDDHIKANNKLKLIAQHQNIPWVGLVGPSPSIVTSPIGRTDKESTPASVNGTARGAGTVDTTTSTSPNEKAITRPGERTPAEENGTARGAGEVDVSGSVVTLPNTITTDRESTPARAAGTARGAHPANDGSSIEHHDPYDQLVGLTGKPFDEAYLNHEVRCHTKAVAKFEKASSDLPDGELKQFVESTLPTLRDHLVMAKRMAPTDGNRINVREPIDRDYNKKQDK